MTIRGTIHRTRWVALLALASCALLLATAAACSDDDDETPEDETAAGAAADAAVGDDADAADDEDAAADDAAAADDGGDEDTAADIAIDDDASDGAVTGRIVSFTYEAPAQVPAGTTITWTNGDVVPHTITAQDGAFDSGTIAVDGTFELTLDTPGTVQLICTIHPTMAGTIEVTAG